MAKGLGALVAIAVIGAGAILAWNHFNRNGGGGLYNDFSPSQAFRSVKANTVLNLGGQNVSINNPDVGAWQGFNSQWSS
jgi:hypothetical protein